MFQPCPLGTALNKHHHFVLILTCWSLVMFEHACCQHWALNWNMKVMRHLMHMNKRKTFATIIMHLIQIQHLIHKIDQDFLSCPTMHFLMCLKYWSHMPQISFQPISKWITSCFARSNLGFHCYHYTYAGSALPPAHPPDTPAFRKPKALAPAPSQSLLPPPTNSCMLSILLCHLRS